LRGGDREDQRVDQGEGDGEAHHEEHGAAVDAFELLDPVRGHQSLARYPFSAPTIIFIPVAMAPRAAPIRMARLPAVCRQFITHATSVGNLCQSASPTGTLPRMTTR